MINFLLSNSIKFENVSFKYENKKDFVLDKINLEIRKKFLNRFFGDSGSGKTTLLDIMACLVDPIKKTNILVNDSKIDSNFLKRNQNNISYTSQKTSVVNDTLIKNICFGIDENEVDKDYIKFIEIAELEDLRVNLAKIWKK